MLEVPLVGDALELSFQIPGGAVKGAAEFIDRARLVAKASPAMSARINVAFDLARGCSRDDHTAVDDPVDMVITWLGDLFLTTGHLPDAGPHLFFLFVEELLADVSVNREVLVTHIRIVLNPQIFGDIDGFQIKQVLPGRADEPAPISLLLLFRVCHG